MKVYKSQTKGLQKAPGCPKPKSGQFYQHFTAGEAARQTASQAQERLLLSTLGLFQKVTGCPKPKSSQFCKQFTDWEASQPASQAQDMLVLSTLCLSGTHYYVCMYECMYVCMYVCTYVCTYVSLSPTHRGQFCQQVTYGQAAFLEGQIPKKGLRRDPGLHKPKTGQFYLQLTYELVSLVFKLPQIPYKNLQKAPGPPKLKRDITHWLGGWLAGSGCFGSILGGTITKVPTLSLNQLAKSSPFF